MTAAHPHGLGPPIAPASHGRDAHWIVRALLQSLPGQHDGLIDRRVGDGCASPRPRYQLLLGDDVVAMRDQPDDGVEHPALNRHDRATMSQFEPLVV
jgi:hypothetical protein